MDVTSKNFLQLLPDISETIKKCDFIAIDTELSGLMRDRNWSIFDFPKDRFAKCVDLSRGYFIMQFGLACFTKIGPLRYTSKTYNFYIFPQSNESATHSDMNRTFSLQAHAIQFLSEHNFDFNQLFKNGLSYLTFAEQKRIKSTLKSESKANQRIDATSGLPTFVPTEYASILKSELSIVKDKYNKFQAKKQAENNSNNDDDVDMKSENVSNISESSRKNDQDFTVILTKCISRHKKAIMKKLLECQPFYDSIEIETENRNRNDANLVVRIVDKEEKQRKHKDASILAKGFLEVLELIIINKKPLVGHNLSLDLIQIINQFVEPLSNDYHSFKETCHSLFPAIYDTKYIAQSTFEQEQLANNASRLEDLYNYTYSNGNFPKIKVEQLDEIDEESDESNNKSPHQAGYDAFMCGCSFINLCEAFLTEKKKLKYKREDPGSKPESITQNQFIVGEFSNKIQMSYSHDFKSFNLDGEEEEPERSHVFYVEHPSTWKLDDLFALFQPYGGINTSKLNPTSSLCALRNLKYKNEVTKLTKQNNPTYRIFTYKHYCKNVKQDQSDCLQVGGND